MTPESESLPQGIESILDFIRWGASRMNEAGVYFGHGTAEALDEAAALTLCALHLPPGLAPPYLEAKLSAEERRRLVALFDRRIDDRLPAAYLTNEAWFAGHPFFVDARVLVPRSPIAELIQRRFHPWVERPGGALRILDLCTGSGCIGIACAHAFQRAQVDMTDLSEAALEVAELNVIEHGLSHRVAVMASDMFTGLEDHEYDLIVSNPPYVPLEDMEELPDEYLREPELGLVAGTNGLDFVAVILAEAARFLAPGGTLVVEAGASWRRVADAWPHIPFHWQTFQKGGEGVFVLTAEELQRGGNDPLPSAGA